MKKKKSIPFNLPKDSNFLIPMTLKIYYKNYNGITWIIRSAIQNNSINYFFIEAKINPKMLINKHDYIIVATYDDMDTVIKNFNLEASKISDLLENFDCYAITRIDYCINFDLDELTDKCSPELLIELIKRGNIPHSYTEWEIYDKTAHRKKSQPGSFYLINNSVIINCYSKYMQLLDRSKRNKEKGYDPVPQKTLDAARNVIRFEVQYKYHTVYTISKEAERAGNHKVNKYESLLTHEYCRDVIHSYYNKIITGGNWYTLEEAIRWVKFGHFNRQKEIRLINTLQLINQCRSVEKAKNNYSDHNLVIFKQTLKYLSSLGINPVTIPKDREVNYIPNLLYAYHNKVKDEEFMLECFKEYFHSHRK